MKTHSSYAFFGFCLLAGCGSTTGVATPGIDGVDKTGQTLSSNDDNQGGNNDDQGEDNDDQGEGVKHVLLISVDGLHEVDAANWIAAHPDSTLAELAGHGVEYTDAHTPTPSDSFPGLTALITGGSPKTTGIYYDDSYDRTLFPPGSGCQGNPGTEATYFEILATDFTQLFSPINPGNLPMTRDKRGACKPVFPHDFIKVNTIFEVIRAAGGYTAWSDKHAAYDIANGPSGRGVIDLYTPEINSLIKNGGVANGVDLTATLAQCDGTTNSLPLSKVNDYTTCMPSVMGYDDVKVQAIVNQIDGKTSDGSKRARVPTIFGMNFQTVSVGQKLPVGGYTDANGTPSTLLASAIAHVDAALGRMVAELKANHLYDSTVVIVTAKHGQSPIDLSLLAMEPGGRGNATVSDPLPFVNAVDPEVDQVFANFVNPNDGSSPVVRGHLQTDDVGIVWLQNQAPDNITGVAKSLGDNAAAIFANTLPPGTIFNVNITSGAEPRRHLLRQHQEDRRARRRHHRRHGRRAHRLEPGPAPEHRHRPRLHHAGRSDHPARARSEPRSARVGAKGRHEVAPRPAFLSLRARNDRHR
jgi:hypothetical protein